MLLSIKNQQHETRLDPASQQPATTFSASQTIQHFHTNSGMESQV